MRERARVRFECGGGQRVGERGERGQSPGGDPRAAALGDDARRAFVVFRREQVIHGLLPLFEPEEVVGDARVLEGDAGAPLLDAQPPLKEAAKERVEAVLFAAPVRGERDEDVAARERLEHRDVVRFGKETAARLGLDAFQKRDAQEKVAHVLGLVGEDLFGEVVEDVAFGLAEDFDEVGRRGGGLALRNPARERLPLRHLPDELERGDPAVRPLAVLGQLLGRQFEVEDLAEQFARLFVGEEQFLPVDDGEAGLRPHPREREGRHVARVMTT